MDKIKIRMFSSHIAYIDQKTYNDFCECSTDDIRTILKAKAIEQFGCELKKASDLKSFNQVLMENYYEGISEWTKDVIRHYVVENKKKL